MVVEMIKENSNILGNSCAAHRFNNMLRESLLSVVSLHECEEVVSDTIAFFKDSSKRLTCLRQLQMEIFDNEIHLATKNTTRWASLGAAVRSYTNSLLPILKLASESNEKEIRTMKKKITTANHIKIVLLLDKILDYVCFTLEALQRSSMTIIESVKEVQKFLFQIGNLYENIKDFEESVKKKWNNYKNYVGNYEENENLKATVAELYTMLQKNFKERFICGYNVCFMLYY
jgi:hypothetical protein